MAGKVEMFVNVKGTRTKVTKAIAMAEVVQAALSDAAFEIGTRAEERLIEHRLEGHAQVQVAPGGAKNPDWYVWLDDEAGDEAAMAIEFGRAGYIDPETGQRWGEMDGLFIITEAAGLHRQLKLRIPIEKLRRESKMTLGKFRRRKRGGVI